ncbi:hypothetical protein [Hymenobacter chitinivorans]|uniref:Secreted protein (Por secretion system target) n=1 Tax=Hymenobacter chitinivorans DSM 11115 TaxID=1121954 RepID=A0A2M9BSG1_9BACT|nr:hypothetical protein [Hymenobacter chitinivorans]PJJ60885.1 hypothetical protein CLV45_2319 [Hymenobacter chitinivorans DSM 11115]
MKQLLLIVSLLIFAQQAQAQAHTCNLELRTQTEVDAFRNMTCTGIDNLSITGGVVGQPTDGIFDLSPLAGITSVTGSVSISLHDLTDIGPLSNITQIGGGLYITGGTALNFIPVNGFQSLATVGGDVIIMNNPSLTLIAGFPLLSKSRTVTISNNAALGAITGFTSLSKTGALSISQCASLRSISGLNALTTVQPIPTNPPTQLPEPVVSITDNPLLEEITGLGALATSGSMMIFMNPALKELTGFNNLKSLTNLYIGANTAMTTLSGFNGGLVVSETGIVNINTNEQLTSITGFSGLNTQSLSIHTNNALKEIPGFAGSRGVTASISGNPALEAVTGFKNANFTNTVQVTDNAKLQRISGFSGTAAPSLIQVSFNPRLTSIIDAFAYSSYTPLSTLRIEYNTALAICAVPWICSYLNRNGLAYFTQNATGCNTNAAVQQACQVLGTPQPDAAQPATAYPNPVTDLLHLPGASKFRICDLMGRVLLQGEGAAVSVAALPEGLYVVQTGPGLKTSFRISKL